LLQGLSSLPSMVRWLSEIDTSMSDLRYGFLYELKDVVMRVEHDLHELLNVFATTWEEELQEMKKRLLSSSLLQFNETDGLPGNCARIGAGSGSSGDAPLSPISRKELVFQRCADIVRVEAKLRAPCFGLTATELRCCQSDCGFKKLRYDTFGVISLTIPKMFMGMSVTIEALLRKYFCMEVIRGATCDRCKSRTGKRDSGLFKKQGFSKVSCKELILFEIFIQLSIV
uniref:WASH-7_N domain-containing protein n=1 Tax=Haemonchus placei TaxID=6290 RepID=A0A0N4WTJ5_HAEPC